MKFYHLITIFLSLILGQTSFATDVENEQSCGAGTIYNTTLNRCVLNEDTIETKSAARSCSGLEGDAFKKCFDDNVQKNLTEAESAGDIKKKSEPEAKYGISAIVTLGAGYLLWKKSDVLAQCGQTSMWLMLGGGASSILGEFMSQSSYKKKLKKIIKKYEDAMSESSENEDENISVINENQKLAFDFQIEQEKARKDAHKARKSAYNLSFGLYTAAALASLYDGLMSSSKGCETAFFTPRTKSSLFNKTYHAMLLNKDIFGSYSFITTLTNSELVEIIKRNLVAQLSMNAFAETGIPKVELAATVVPKLTAPKIAQENVQIIKKIEANSKQSGTDSTIDKAIKNPYYRAAIAGILAGYSKSVASKAGKLAKEAQKRISLLETLRDDFIATGGSAFQSCTPEDRESLSKLNCYCFLSDGTRNPKRKSSNACQGVYAQGANLESTAYGVGSSGTSSGLKGCFDKKRKFDPDCKCKKDKDKSGKNSCFALSGKVSLGGLASIGELKSVMKDAKGFTSGNISTGSLNQGGIERLALKANKLKKKISKNPKYRKKVLKVDQLQRKLKKQIEGRAKRGLASGAISNPFLGGLNQSNSPITRQNVLKNLKNDLASKSPIRKRGKGSQRNQSSRSLNDYDLGGGSSGSAITVDNSNDIMEKEYNFNDINENSNNNIFKIISVRYQRSGFRRLFDESGKLKADIANETDINEK